MVKHGHESHDTILSRCYCVQKQPRIAAGCFTHSYVRKAEGENSRLEPPDLTRQKKKPHKPKFRPRGTNTDAQTYLISEMAIHYKSSFPSSLALPPPPNMRWRKPLAAGGYATPSISRFGSQVHH